MSPILQDQQWVGENMNKISISFILIISLIGCVSAAFGQSAIDTLPTEATGYAANVPGIAQGTATQYSEYYTMPTGPKPVTHIITPQKYAIEGRTPTRFTLATRCKQSSIHNT